MYVDYSGEIFERATIWLLEKSIKLYRVKLGCATDMLLNWLYGSGSFITYGDDSEIAKKLKKSDKMKEIVRNELQSYRSTGDWNTQGVVCFDSSGQWDLWLSLRNANYTINIETVTFSFGSHFEFCYELVSVEISDTYNFNAAEFGDGLGSTLTNIAYYAHKLGIGKDYDFKINYSLIRNRRFKIK